MLSPLKSTRNCRLYGKVQGRLFRMKTGYKRLDPISLWIQMRRKEVVHYGFVGKILLVGSLMRRGIIVRNMIGIINLRIQVYINNGMNWIKLVHMETTDLLL